MTTLAWEATVGHKLIECAVSRGGRLDDIESEVYLDKLGDLDAALLARVLDQMALEPRKEFEPVVPSVPAIRVRCEALARQDADREAARKLLPLPASDDDPRTWVHCPDCRDESSGWREAWCIGGGAQADRESHSPHHRSTRPILRTYCGRKMAHGPHSYVMRCGCVGTNPVIAKRRAAQARPTTEAR